MKEVRASMVSQDQLERDIAAYLGRVMTGQMMDKTSGVLRVRPESLVKMVCDFTGADYVNVCKQLGIDTPYK